MESSPLLSAGELQSGGVRGAVESADADKRVTRQYTNMFRSTAADWSISLCLARFSFLVPDSGFRFGLSYGGPMGRRSSAFPSRGCFRNLVGQQQQQHRQKFEGSYLNKLPFLAFPLSSCTSSTEVSVVLSPFLSLPSSLSPLSSAHPRVDSKLPPLQEKLVVNFRTNK